MAANKRERSEDQQFKDAYRLAYSLGKWRLAFPIWKKLADKGFVRSAFHVGVCYDDGLGVKKDIKKAFDYYKSAADKGHPESLYNVYLMYYAGLGVKRSVTSALKCLKLAVSQNEINAIRDLGYHLHEGLGLKKNFRLSASNYRIAAKRGDGIAQWNLSLCYISGEGVPVSKRWSKYWLVKAARTGNSNAIKKLRS